MGNKPAKLNGLFAIFFMAILATAPAFSKDVRVTVNSGESHMFKGFGGNAVYSYRCSQWLETVSEPVRDSMAKMIWEDLDFRVMRLNALFNRDIAANFATSLTPWINTARKYQDSLVLLFAPYNWGTLDTNNTLEYTEKVAQFIKDLKDLGINVDVTGVENEPSCAGLPDRLIPTMVKDLRRELDSRGLQDVNLIAPEQPTVQRPLWKDAPLFADEQALASLDGWGFHSYAMSMTKGALDSVRKYNFEEIWQTEAGADDHNEEDVNDSVWSATSAGLFLGDVNLGANYWVWFLPYSNVDNWSTPRLGAGLRMIGFAVDGSNQMVVYPKYYYFKQLALGFRPGTMMRFCTSDLGNESYQKYMEGTFGNRPHIHAAAGIRPDGRWTLGVVNVTGIPRRFYTIPETGEEKSTMIFPDEQMMNVTFHVEELGDAGTVDFTLERTNGSVKNQAGGTVTMENGNITVSVQPCELVTLVATAVVSVSHGSRENATQAREASVSSTYNTGYMISFPNKNNGYAAGLGIWDMQGKLVRKLNGNNGRNASLGIYWDGTTTNGTTVPHGLYIARDEAGASISFPVMR